jgi:hypothetical protein
MIVQLKKKYQCKELIEELDELVKGAVGLFDDFSSCRVSGYNVQKIKRFETIILDYLLEKTNFEDAFDSIKISYGDIKTNFHTVIYNLLCRIGQKQLDPTFDNLLKVLDDKIKELKKKPIEKFTYYIPTRIESQLTEIEFKDLKKSLKKALGISLLKLPKKVLNQIKSDNYKSFMRSRQIIIKFEIKARDYTYPIKILDNKIYAFVGALAFSNHFYRDKEKWMSSYSDMSIAVNPIEDHAVIVKNNNEVVYPHDSRWQILNYEIQKEISLIGKEIWNIHNRQDGNYKRLKAILDLLEKQDKKILEISEDSLKLYLEAISEKQLEISFLKFWIITERVLKQGGKRNDISLLNVLKKIIKEKHLKRMIDGLYRKRNDLVHEFRINYISQQDRNLAKAISESVILFLIDPPTKINNVQDLRTVIDNIFLSKDELKKKKSIISKIMKSKK